MQSMELKQFIKESLLGIVNGVRDANLEQERFKIIGMKRNGDIHTDGNEVDFDISITVDQKSNSETGVEGKVGTPILSVFAASIDGSLKSNSTDSHQNIHRLKFKVWISEN